MSRIEGIGSKESPLLRELWQKDTRPLSVALQQEGNYWPSLKSIPFSTYFDPEYAQLEMEHVWKKCWQFVCREEDIPHVGDRYVYDVGRLSFVIVRSEENSFKAFYNACMHRGTRLCSAPSGGNDIRCPFHGWSWNLNGSLKNVPGKWDFPQIDDSFKLPAVKIGSWGGCLFINPDQNSGSLDDALGILKEHFAHFDLAKRFTLVKTAKKVRANWKNVWAAFLEAYHVAETHFDAVDFNGDSNTKYDIFNDGKSIHGRLITPSAVPSPSLNDEVTAHEAAIIAAKSFANALGPAAEDTLPNFDELPNFGRPELAEWRRDVMKNMLGVDLSAASDSEMIDAAQYDMFPNFGPWLGEGLPLMYQFLPYGDDPNESLFVVRLLAPVGDESMRPPAAPMTELNFDQFFEDTLPQWGRIAHVFDQDMANLPNVQKGMHAASKDHAHLILGRYQEQRVALMHEFVEAKIRGE